MARATFDNRIQEYLKSVRRLPTPANAGMTLDGTQVVPIFSPSGTELAAVLSTYQLQSRVGSYSSPYAADAGGFVGMSYHFQSAGDDSYVYCLFTTTKGAAAGNDLLIGIHNTTHIPAGGSAKTAQAGQFHVVLDDATSSLLTRGGDLTAGGICIWAKLSGPVGSSFDSGSLAANIWLDNQMSGTKSGTLYSIFSSSSATATAWAGFANDAAGWTNLLRFEGTNTPPVSAGGSGDISFSGTWFKIACDFNGTTAYLVASASPS